VEYTALLVSVVCKSPIIGRSMPSTVRAPVITIGVMLLKAPSMSIKAAKEYSLFICFYGTHVVRWRVGLGWYVARCRCQLAFPGSSTSRKKDLSCGSSFGVTSEGLPAFGINITLTFWGMFLGKWVSSRSSMDSWPFSV